MTFHAEVAWTSTTRTPRWTMATTRPLTPRASWHSPWRRTCRRWSKIRNAVNGRPPPIKHMAPQIHRTSTGPATGAVLTRMEIWELAGAPSANQWIQTNRIRFRHRRNSSSQNRCRTTTSRPSRRWIWLTITNRKLRGSKKTSIFLNPRRFKITSTTTPKAGSRC